MGFELKPYGLQEMEEYLDEYRQHQSQEVCLVDNTSKYNVCVLHGLFMCPSAVLNVVDSILAAMLSSLGAMTQKLGEGGCHSTAED